MNARRLRLLLVVVLGLLAGSLALPSAALAADYVPISGSGSTWAQNALDQWRRNVNQLGMTVNYQGTGSSDGRNQFRNGTVDFAVSEIPYGLTDGGVKDVIPTRPLSYAPLVAGGLGIGFNLKVDGQQLKNLRLSGKTVAKIFTGQVTRWNDPSIRADNGGIRLPDRQIVPVVRSDGSGTTHAFTSFLAERYPDYWADYAQQAGRAGGEPTSHFPILNGSTFVAQSGSLGVSGYVSQQQNDGTITYVENSYLRNARIPTADLRNAAGYFVGPNGYGPAIALAHATTESNGLADLSSAYANTDPRSYPIPHVSYGIIPTGPDSGNFGTARRTTLGHFLSYAMCEGANNAFALGYSPLPLNLVRKTFDAIGAMRTADPGADLADLDPEHCENPYFDSEDLTTDVLGTLAPFPRTCQKAGAGPCGTSDQEAIQHFGGPPVLSGTARIGGTVHVDKGDWMNAGSFRYYWIAGGVQVGRTTVPSIRVPAAAGGKRLGVTVVGTSLGGFRSITIRSNTRWIPRGTQRITTLGIGGRPIVGRKLTAVVTCSPGAVRHFQWYAAGRPITGATRATWILRPAQRGKRITVKVTLTRTGYITVSRTSARTATVRAS